MTAPDAQVLDDLLPPPAPEGEDLVPEFEPTPAPAAPRPLTDADRASINAHIEGLIQAAAAAGADTLPPELRNVYEQSFTTSRLVRAGVQATGIGPALHELMPSDGTEAAGPIKQLHPIARVLLGVGVLAVASLLQRKQVLSAYQLHASRNAGGPAGPASGGLGVPVNHGQYGGHH
ncbi:hypothetical protein V3W47_18965 [Deinococcus sp. YIM 134068]|uniref:hypothetical protein n=1 Tax=Deinococcus lichenicola TaxID=3118910 RepID=UPI002F95D186